MPADVLPPGKERWSTEVIAVAAIASCAPLLLLLFNRDWMQTHVAFLDPWHYEGFFRHYLNPSYSVGAYKVARLPWILTGFSVNQVLPPLAAAYVLHGVFLCATGFALFLALRALLGRVSLAGVLATVFGFYTHAHGSGGWDYNNTPGGFLYLITVWMLALPVVLAGRPVAMMLAGAVAAVAVHTNILLVNFLPVLAFVHLRTIQVRIGAVPPVRALAARVGWALLGAALVTVLLGVINWLAGREFVFSRSLFNLVTHFVSDPEQYQAVFWKPWSAWVLGARYLALPIAVFVAGAVALIRSRRQDPIADALLWQFVAMAVVWTIWQAAGQTALDAHYMAYPLTPSCFLALGGLLVRSWPHACERYSPAFAAATALLCVFCLVGVLDWSFRIVTAAVASTSLLAGGLVFGAGLLVFFLRPGLTTTLVLILVLAVGNRLAATQPRQYSAFDPCQFEPETFSAVVEAEAWLGSIDPTYARIRTWFDERETIEPQPGCRVLMGAIASAITTMSNLPYVTRPFPMPAVDDVPAQAVQTLASNRGRLAIVSNSTDTLERWTRRLEHSGLVARSVAQHTTHVRDSAFTIHVWEIEQRLPSAVTFAEPILTITERTPPGINVYGIPRGQLTTDGDRVVFTPTDARDHVSYPFVTLPPLTADSWARVVVEAPAPASPSCQLIVQTIDLTPLAALDCSSSTHALRVPRDTRAIRVYLADTTRAAFILPKRIELSLAQTPF